jgi:hypothetical protein
MTDNWQWIGKDLEGNGSSLIEVLSGIYLEGRSKTMKTLSEDSWFSGWDSNRESAEYKSRALHVDQAIQSKVFLYAANREVHVATRHMLH